MITVKRHLRAPVTNHVPSFPSVMCFTWIKERATRDGGEHLHIEYTLPVKSLDIYLSF